MDLTLYQAALQQFTDSIRSDLDQLTLIPAPQFRTLPINCSAITDGCAHWTAELKKAIPAKQTPVLYYFTLQDSSLSTSVYQLVEQLKVQTKNTSDYRALPRVNHMQQPGSILYVGKTNSNFINRFEEHLGLKYARTYSLQLKHWACRLDLKLELHYAPVDLEKSHIKYLELMESVLHKELKPILGRSGH